MSKRIKIHRAALAGCGRVGFLLERDPLRPKPCSHAGAIASHPGFKLVAGCDINPDRLADFGRTCGVPAEHLYADVAELIAREKLDLLSIATWTESHDRIVELACRAGIPAVVCEKPMSVTAARAARMHRLARRSGTLLLINHGRRWCPRYRAVKQAVESGRYGPLRRITGTVLTSFGRDAGSTDWHQDLSKVGGGPLLHDGTHLFDIVFYVTGRRGLWVECELQRHRRWTVEHRASGRMRLDGDPPVDFLFDAGGARNYFHFELDLWFDAGRIRIGNGIGLAETSITSRRYTGFRDLSPDPDFAWPEAGQRPEYVQMSELTGWFRGGDQPDNSSGDALLSQQAIFACYRSAALKKRVRLAKGLDRG